MKSMVLEMDSLTESRELYLENPNRFVFRFISITSIVTLIAVVCILVCKIDLVVKETGTLRFDKQGNLNLVYFHIGSWDVTKIKEGMKVRCQLPALKQEGCNEFEGTIIDIGNNVVKEKNETYGFYLVKVKLDDSTLVNKEREEVELRGGMECSICIVLGEERIIDYILKK